MELLGDEVGSPGETDPADTPKDVIRQSYNHRNIYTASMVSHKRLVFVSKSYNFSNENVTAKDNPEEN